MSSITVFYWTLTWRAATEPIKQIREHYCQCAGATLELAIFSECDLRIRETIWSHCYIAKSGIGMDAYGDGQLTGLADEELLCRVTKWSWWSRSSWWMNLASSQIGSSPCRSGNQGSERATDLPWVTQQICPSHPNFWIFSPCPHWRSSLLVLGKLAEGACCPGSVLILSPVLNDLMDYGIPLEVRALVYSWKTGNTSQREKSTGSFHPTSNPAAGGY